MKVKVCDALCGSGKTSACINMMNSRTDSKFIFVTQYLSEVERIKKSCASREFISPGNDGDASRTKLADIHWLISQGANIATTHALFSNYIEETKELIREQKYILVLDEVVDVFQMSDIAPSDLRILLKSETVKEDDDGGFCWMDEEYDVHDESARFRDEMIIARSKKLIKYDNEYFFWSIPPDLFTCFEEAYVLTYMFEAQTLRCFFDMHNIDYELIGASNAGGEYHFCPIDQMNRARELRDKIHIYDNVKINSIGAGRTPLSFTWYRTAAAEPDTPKLERLKKNLVNLYKNVWKIPSTSLMWATYKDVQEQISCKGTVGAFVPYNKRASNEYANRTHLAYLVNNFYRPWERNFFLKNGVEVDGEMYALSIFIQWIFRSAIRNGEEIWVYVPSDRMRYLLVEWMNNLAEGNDLAPIAYKTPRKPKPKMPARRGRPPKGIIKRGRPAGTQNKKKEVS